MLDGVKALIIATRPKQWTKNAIIYFAFFFSLEEAAQLRELDPALTAFAETTAAFALFCALTEAVYLVNDIVDIEKDRLHPKKQFRPIPAGRLSVRAAWTAAVLLTIVSLGLSFVLQPQFGAVATGYFVLMMGYSFVLKKVVLLDIFSISAGFVLRAVAGAAVLAVPISPWLYICTALGSLLIALGKRRSELVAAGTSAASQRDALAYYDTPLVDQFISIVAPSTLVAYTLYTFTAENLPENHSMMLTIPFAVYGLFRYVYLIHTRTLGERPEDMLVSDVPLIATIALWLASAATVLVVFGRPV